MRWIGIDRNEMKGEMGREEREERKKSISKTFIFACKSQPWIDDKKISFLSKEIIQCL